MRHHTFISRSTNKGQLLCAIAFIVCLSTRTPAQEPSWQGPYQDRNTIGGQLENQFNDLFSDCGITGSLRKALTKDKGPGKKEERLGDAISKIPYTLQRNLDVGSTPARTYNFTLSGLFNNVYTQRVLPPTDWQPLGADELDPDLLRDPNSMNQFQSVVYSNTCGTVLDLAASAEFGISFPFVTVKSALHGELDSQHKSILTLMQGVLQNPYGAMLKQGDNRAKTYAYLLGWQWYSSHSKGQQAYYLQQLNGIGVYRFYQSQLASNVQFTLDASGGITFAKLRGETKLALTDKASTEVKKPLTLIYPWTDASQPDFQKLPAPTTIIDFIASQSTKLVNPDYNPVVLPDVENRHDEVIQGVPKGFCLDGPWKLEPNYDDRLRISVVKRDESTPSLPDCIFTISYRELAPPPDVRAPLELKYSLVYQPVGRDEGLKFKAQTLNLVRVDSPHLEYAFGADVVDHSIEGNNHTLTWKSITLSVTTDDRETLDWGTVPEADGPAQAACPAGPLYNLLLQPTLDQPTRVLTLKAAITIAGDPGFNFPGTSGNLPRDTTVACPLKGSIKFRMSDRRQVSKPLPAKTVINFPKMSPFVSLGQRSLTFSGQTIGSKSSALQVNLTNTGGASLSIGELRTTGDHASDFIMSDNTCGTSVAAGAKCSISIVFNPSAPGNRTASLIVSDDASGSPHTVSLTGIGTEAAPGPSPSDH